MHIEAVNMNYKEEKESRNRTYIWSQGKNITLTYGPTNSKIHFIHRHSLHKSETYFCGILESKEFIWWHGRRKCKPNFSCFSFNLRRCSLIYGYIF